MSKKLLIIRHAKSDWNNPDLRDFDRPLNERGERNAPEMAKRLIKNDLVPQLLVSSPAVRALTTAELFAQVLGFDKKAIVQFGDSTNVISFTVTFLQPENMTITPGRSS